MCEPYSIRRLALFKKIQGVLARQGCILLDGGLSEELGGKDAKFDPVLWTAALIVDDPEEIINAHLRCLCSGSNVLITSSYQATPQLLAGRAKVSNEEGLTLLRKSTDLALEAKRRFIGDRKGTDTDVLVAASIGPFGAHLADGSEYRGEYAQTWQEVKAHFTAQFKALRDSGQDLYAIETIPSAKEALVAVQALAEADPEARCWVTFSCRSATETSAGEDFRTALKDTLMANGEQILAIGVNCTSPEHTDALLATARSVVDEITPPPSQGFGDFLLCCYPNSGEGWDAEAKTWIPLNAEDATHEDPMHSFAEHLYHLRRVHGVQLLGGCCRISSKHIHQASDTLRCKVGQHSV
eukprot:Clim_evm11s252 gene=Clim_evmTU11s252